MMKTVFSKNIVIVTHYTYELFPLVQPWLIHIQLYCAYHGYEFIAIKRPTPKTYGSKHMYFGATRAILDALDLQSHDYLVYVAPDMFFADMSFQFEPVIEKYMIPGVDILVPCQHLGSDDGGICIPAGSDVPCDLRFCIACNEADKFTGIAEDVGDCRANTASMIFRNPGARRIVEHWASEKRCDEQR